MAEQKRKHEEQMEEMKEELRRKELEMKNKEEEIKNTTESSPPLVKGVVVVEINDENEGQVSITHNGMIMNKDGTLSRTPQSETWAKNRNHQLVRRYETTPKMPEYLNSIPGHPTPTNLNLEWSHVGDWYDVPLGIDKDAEGTQTRIGRVEPYIDRDGTIKKAISYGSDKGTLSTWYSLEKVKETFPKWVIPDPPRYYNNKSFNPTVRRKETQDTTWRPV